MSSNTRVTVLTESELRQPENVSPFVGLCMRNREQTKSSAEAKQKMIIVIFISILAGVLVGLSASYLFHATFVAITTAAATSAACSPLLMRMKLN